MTHEFAGDLETHLTIAADEESSPVELQRWGAKRGLKCVYIVLARGRTGSQPMLTRRGRGTLSQEKRLAERLAEELAPDGFRVNRIKIEAAPWNPDVPQTDDAGRRHAPARYFEHHIKLLLPAAGDLAELTATAQRHGAHLSRNAFKRRDDGLEERFVTQRCYGVGRNSAREKLLALQAELKGRDVLDVEEEFVIYDSNEAIDAGWLHPAS